MHLSAAMLPRPVARERSVPDMADLRVPHSVLPTHSERYAVSIWYSEHDSEVQSRARDVEYAQELNARVMQAVGAEG